MKKFQYLLCACLLASLTFNSCKKDEPEPEPVLGCMDENSMTFNPNATQDDGSCEYPDKYMPMTAGNEWHLSDSITIPLVGGAMVHADFTMFGDTTIDGVHYYQMRELITAGALGTLQDETYLYRQAITGEVYRTAIGDSVETIFLEYPLDLGVNWYDTPDQTGYYCEVFSTALITVPAGTFTAAGIHFNNMSDGSVQDLYFAKDGGLIRVDISYDFLGTPINAQLELDSYVVN